MRTTQIALSTQNSQKKFRSYVADKLSPRISSVTVPTNNTASDESLPEVAKDSVEIFRSYSQDGDGSKAAQQMDNLTERFPDAMETLQKLSKPHMPMSFEMGPTGTFQLGLAKVSSPQQKFQTLFIDTTPGEAGIEVVSVLERDSSLQLDAT